MKKLLFLIFLIPSVCFAAVELDGNGDYLNLGSAAAIDNIPAGGIIISVWVRPDDTIADSDNFVIKYGSGGWTFELNTTDTFQMWQQFSGAVHGLWRADNSTLAVDGTWQHIGVFYDNTSVDNNAQLYYNGAATNTTEITTPSGGSSATSDADGNLTVGTSGTKYDGGITELAIWKTTSDHSAAEWLNLGLSLVKGMPLMIDPDNLLIYLPLDGTCVDAVGTADCSLNGDAAYIPETILSYGEKIIEQH